MENLFATDLARNGYMRRSAPPGMKNVGQVLKILTPAPTSIRHATRAPKEL